jgi:hypothetical protein
MLFKDPLVTGEAGQAVAVPGCLFQRQADADTLGRPAF